MVIYLLTFKRKTTVVSQNVSFSWHEELEFYSIQSKWCYLVYIFVLKVHSVAHNSCNCWCFVTPGSRNEEKRVNCERASEREREVPQRVGQRSRTCDRWAVRNRAAHTQRHTHRCSDGCSACADEYNLNLAFFHV